MYFPHFDFLLVSPISVYAFSYDTLIVRSFPAPRNPTAAIIFPFEVSYVSSDPSPLGMLRGVASCPRLLWISCGGSDSSYFTESFLLGRVATKAFSFSVVVEGQSDDVGLNFKLSVTGVAGT